MAFPRVLLTGSTGFCGRHLVKYLEHMPVELLPHNSSVDLRNLNYTMGLPHADILIHTAGNSSTRHLDAPAVVMADNIHMAENLAVWAMAHEIKRIIFLSSVSLYGNIEGILTEDSPRVNPSAYGMSKSLCEEVFSETGINTAALRLPAVVGKGAHRHFLANVMAQAEQGMDIEITNATSPWNNVVHIDFLCQMIFALCSGLAWPSHKRFWPVLVASRAPESLGNIVLRMVRGKSRVIQAKGSNKTSTYYTDISRLGEFILPWTTAETIEEYVRDVS